MTKAIVGPGGGLVGPGGGLVGPPSVVSISLSQPFYLGSVYAELHQPFDLLGPPISRSLHQLFDLVGPLGTTLSQPFDLIAGAVGASLHQLFDLLAAGTSGGGDG